MAVAEGLAVESGSPPAAPVAATMGQPRLRAGRPSRAVIAYLLAAATSGMAWLLSGLLERWVDAGDLPLFLGAVMIATWAGGIGPGLLSTVIALAAGLVAHGAWVGGPAGDATTPASLARLAVFTIEALVIASLTAALRTARRRAEDLSEGLMAARAESEARAVRLRDLLRVTDTAAGHLNLEALMHELLVRVREVLSADTVVFLLLSETGDYLDVRAALGLEEEVRAGIRVPMGRGLAGRIAVERRPLVFDDLSSVEIWSPVLRSKGLKALLGAPLLVDGRTLGVVHVGSLEPRRFTGDDTLLLQRVADRIAIAIDRARLLDRVIAAQEDERRHLARELHDETGQSLTSLLVGLRTLQDASSVEAAREQAAALRQVALRTLDDVRRVARGLRPRVLDDLGLVDALEQYAAEYSQAHGMTVDVEARELTGVRLPPALETTLYRIVQEGLTNAAVHGRAGHVSVVLRRTPDGVLAIVADDGAGFDVEALAARRGGRAPLGLRGMQERATLLGGTVTVESAPSEGATVYVRLPMGKDRG